jgi:hypothetical protein
MKVLFMADDPRVTRSSGEPAVAELPIDPFSQHTSLRPDPHPAPEQIESLDQPFKHVNIRPLSESELQDFQTRAVRELTAARLYQTAKEVAPGMREAPQTISGTLVPGVAPVETACAKIARNVALKPVEINLAQLGLSGYSKAFS